MSRVALALTLAFLVVPLASAQFSSRPSVIIGEPPRHEQTILVDLRVETTEDEKTRTQTVMPWLVAGHDNLVNLTVRNNRDAHLNATFTINVTGAAFTPEPIVFQLGPYGWEGKTFVVHPDDLGMVEIGATATDAFQVSGDPLDAGLTLPALVLPSMRFLDPPPRATSDDDEFVAVDSFRGGHSTSVAYLRIQPGDAIRPRIELTNPFESTIAGFRLEMRVPGQSSPALDIPPIGPGGTYVAEFSESTPVERSFGPSFGGPAASFELRPIAKTTLGAASVEAAGAEFRIERGAVVGTMPATALIDVQDGLAIDLFVPREPVLGAPTRVKYNLTNLDARPVQGPLVITLSTPHGLFYEVQGPQSHEIQVAMGPGERSSGAIEFTPRVSGPWTASTLFRSPEGYGFGNGGGFDVRGPVIVGFDRTDQIFARIGEPIEVGIVLATTDTLQDASLRIGATSDRYRDPSLMTGAEYRPGFASTLVESQALSSSLGTLRPGGIVNTSVEFVGRSSGAYNIIPYVLAEGFAYTTTIQLDPATGLPVDLGLPLSNGMLNVAVQPRPLPAGLSLAPLTLGLAFFVGMWTMRTRWVK